MNSDIKSKHSDARTFEEIVKDVRNDGEKAASSQERYISLYNEFYRIKRLTDEQANIFFQNVKERLGDGWIPFLTRVSIGIDPRKIGNDQIILRYITNTCVDSLESFGVSAAELENIGTEFLKSTDGDIISSLLTKASNSANYQNEQSRQKAQELACAVFMFFSLDCRRNFIDSYKQQLVIDRTIVEFFAKESPKKLVGKSLGTILSARAFSLKRISELRYLYSDTVEKSQQQEKKIKELEQNQAVLIKNNASLHNEVNKWKDIHGDLLRQIDVLTQENEKLARDKIATENMMDFERNKYERQMMLAEKEISEQLAEDLSLELQAIRETTEYINEADRRRICRRLDRIDEILQHLQETDGNINA